MWGKFFDICKIDFCKVDGFILRTEMLLYHVKEERNAVARYGRLDER